MANFRDPVTLDDLENYAASHLDKNAFDYFSTGAGDDVSLNENRQAFKRYFVLSSIENILFSSCMMSNYKIEPP